MAANGIEQPQILRLAEPPGIDEVGLMAATAADSTVIEPPASADHTLTHSLTNNNNK